MFFSEAIALIEPKLEGSEQKGSICIFHEFQVEYTVKCEKTQFITYKKI